MSPGSICPKARDVVAISLDTEPQLTHQANVRPILQCVPPSQRIVWAHIFHTLGQCGSHDDKNTLYFGGLGQITEAWIKCFGWVTWVCSCGSVVDHCFSSTKVVGSIPRKHTYWQYNYIPWMHCKSLWIKASAKCKCNYILQTCNKVLKFQQTVVTFALTV